MKYTKSLRYQIIDIIILFIRVLYVYIRISFQSCQTLPIVKFVDINYTHYRETEWFTLTR